MEYDCLGENCGFGTLSLKFVRCQNPYQQQNLKILSTFQGHKIPRGQNFWNLFFLSEKTRLLDITSTKINLGSPHLHTTKLLMKSHLLA